MGAALSCVIYTGLNLLNLLAEQNKSIVRTESYICINSDKKKVR